jgi:hypothetical protein
MWEIVFAAIMFGSCATANHWHHKPAPTQPPAITQEYSSSRDTKLPWANEPNWEVSPLPDTDPYKDMFPEPRYSQQFRTDVI